MSISFNIVDQDTIPYEKVKQLYIKGYRYPYFHENYGIGRSQYFRLLLRFQEDGVSVPLKRTPVSDKAHYNPSNIHRRLVKGIPYWVVTKVINGETHYFGNYKNRAEAEQKRNELKQNNWEGLL